MGDNRRKGSEIKGLIGGLRVIAGAVEEAKNATRQDYVLASPEALGPNREGCEDPGCSRTECLHLGICWEDAFWDDGPDAEEGIDV